MTPESTLGQSGAGSRRAREPALGPGLPLARVLSLVLVLVLALALALVLAAGTARAQTPEASDRPGQRPLELPAYAEPEEAPLEAPGSPTSDTAADRGPGALAIVPREIVIRGNTTLPDESLRRVADRYVGRPLGGAELERLRREVTRLYVEAGYATSGAVIPDQDLRAGRLVVAVVEGRLGTIEVENARGFRPAYLAARLRGPEGEVLNLVRLEQRLRRLRDDPRIRALRAELLPDPIDGAHRLHVRVVEEPRHVAELAMDNHRSPALGSLNGNVSLGIANPFHRGDDLRLAGGFSEGLVDLLGEYRIPVTRVDTRLELRARWSRAELVDDSLDPARLEADYSSLFAGLAQPLPLAEGVTLTFRQGLEWRRSETRLDGDCFDPIESPALLAVATGCTRPTTAVIDLSQDLVVRRARQVLALRSSLRLGLDALGAEGGPPEPDDFRVWLLRAQWLRQIGEQGLELRLRGDLQLAFDPLLPFEAFSVGGRYSVRGVRQSLFVRDSGWTVGSELQLPVLRRPDELPILRLVPFFDAGRSWSHDRGGLPRPETALAAGAGLVWTPRENLDLELFYGRTITAPDPLGESDLQDDGVFFRVAARSF